MVWRLRGMLLVGWDAVSWAIALTLALALRYEFDLNFDDVSALVRLIVVAVVAQVLIGVALQVYRGRHCIGSIDDAVDTTASIAFSGTAVFVVNFLLHAQLTTPRSVAIIATPIALLLAVGSRIWVRLYRDRRSRPDPSTAQRVIIFGAGVEGQQVLRSMLTDPEAHYLPVAFLDDDPRQRRLRISRVAVQGTSAKVAEVAARTRADVLVMTGHVDDAAIREMSCAAAQAGLEVKAVAPLAELLKPVPAALLIPSQTGSAATSDRVMTRLAAPVQSRAKRFVDITLSLIALVILLPAFITIAAVLMLTSGEVLYRAKRVGRGGEIFTMFKFSTMVPDDNGPRLTRAGDPRITPIGRWLRVTKLNELPQLINVIKGEMSLVGPRPEDPQYAAFYSAEQREVLSVRPGMASLAFLRFGDEEAYIERADPADIETYYLNELLPEKLDIELQYVRNWTMLGDFRILARTLTGLLA